MRSPAAAGADPAGDAREIDPARDLPTLEGLVGEAIAELAGSFPRTRRLLLVIARITTARESRTTTPADAVPGYLAWLDDLARAGQRRSWLLQFQLPPEPPRAGAERELAEAGAPVTRRPWMSGVVALAVLTGLLTMPVVNHGRCAAPWSLTLDTRLRRAPLGPSTTQCVGLGTVRHRFFADLPATEARAPALREVEERIAVANMD